MVQRLWSTAVSDDETIAAMKRTFTESRYIADPHTGVGLEAVRRYRKEFAARQPMLTLATAHPGKFHRIVEQALGIKVELPQPLQDCLKREKKAQPLPNDFGAFKEFLWELT